MKLINIFSPQIAKVVLSGVMIFAVISCNKPFPEAEPINHTVANPEATQSIGNKISTDTSYSIYLAAVNRVGMLSKLSDPDNVFTVFAPDNNAFRLSGIPSKEAIGVMPIASVGAIVQYSIIPGVQYTSSGINASFPNMQLPTAMKIGDLPGTPLPLEMTTFPSKSNGFWINNLPVITPDMKFTNGVIHKPLAVVAPPSQVLKDAIYANPDLSYFKAAIARADSGTTGLASFDYLLGYAVTNMTVLVPNNAAFQQLIFGAVYSYLVANGVDPTTAEIQATALASSPTVFSNPALYSVLTAATVRGILAYHFIASNKSGAFQPDIRVFSNNFATTPTFYKTLVNSSVGIHPGILVQPTYTGPMVSGITFTGMGTFPPGGQPFSGTPANALSIDKAAVNGVYYVIDRVLLPQ